MHQGDQPPLDLLSEVVAVERDRSRLYGAYLPDAPAELYPKLLEYAEQSRRNAWFSRRRSAGSAETRRTSRPAPRWRAG